MVTRPTALALQREGPSSSQDLIQVDLRMIVAGAAVDCYVFPEKLIVADWESGAYQEGGQHQR